MWIGVQMQIIYQNSATYRLGGKKILPILEGSELVLTKARETITKTTNAPKNALEEKEETAIFISYYEYENYWSMLHREREKEINCIEKLVQELQGPNRREFIYKEAWSGGLLWYII